jgi:hypothetical protein
MGDFFGGAGQLIFDLLEHDSKYTSDPAPRQRLFDPKEIHQSSSSRSV